MATRPEQIRRNIRKQRQQLLVTSGIIGVATLVDLPFLLSPLNVQLLTVASVLAVISAGVFFLAWRGYVALGGWALSLVMLAALLIVLPLDTLTKPVLLAYMLPLLVAGLVVSSNAVLLCGGLLALTLGVRLSIENHGLSVQPPVVIVLFSVVTGLLWIILRDLEGSLRQAQTATQLAEQARSETEAQRDEAAQRNQDLQAAYAQQQHLLDTIQDLETPIMPLQDDLLVVPLIGHIDTRRSQAITDRVLEAVHSMRAKYLILDISGVTIVDTSVAKHIHMLTQAVQLLGTEVMITGITAAVATTMMELDIDFGVTATAATLNDGFQRIALRQSRAN